MNKIIDIINYFNDILPNVGCELCYSKDYELLIAVRLSAQCSDVKVNNVTEVLFKRFPDLTSLAKASIEEIGEIIKPLGLQSVKSKDVYNIANELLNRFNGKVPSSRIELESLPGVGHKTAGVVLVELFDQDEFPVDTHVFRIAKRLELTPLGSSVLECEINLKKFFPKGTYKTLHHQFIHFGRKICFARNPNCKICKLSKYCCKN